MFDDETRFHFECEGIEVELVGDDAFVETMYRRLMRDVDAARRTSSEAEQTPSPSPRPEAPADVVWVIRCSEMVRRVYMVEASRFRESRLARCLTPEALGNLYVDREVTERIAPELIDRTRTLWAELTEAAHDQIEDS